MSASADYNVSIIENFVPPKQFVPGQTVTKEEAVVNTGSIDAFIKQTISGVMTVSVPVPTDVKPYGDAEDYIKLNAKEVGMLEAGSYLAWAPAGSTKTKGEKVVYAMDSEDPNATTGNFQPDVEGLYVFRRAVVKEDATDVSYDYVGYYFVPDNTFYKLHNASLVVAPASIGENGDLNAEPTFKFSKKVTKTLNKLPMEYQAANNRLKIQWNAESSADTSTLAALDRDVYDALQKKLDYEVGKTKWEDTYTALADDEFRGTTTYDNLFDYTTGGGTEANDKYLDPDYKNYSKSRLTDAKNEQQLVINPLTPNGTDADADWNSAYNTAKAQRKTINEGIIASGKLNTAMWAVADQIGGPSEVTDASTIADSKLYMVTTAATSPATDADTHTWSAKITGNTYL